MFSSSRRPPAALVFGALLVASCAKGSGGAGFVPAVVPPDAGVTPNVAPRCGADTAPAAAGALTASPASGSSSEPAVRGGDGDGGDDAEASGDDSDSDADATAATPPAQVTAMPAGPGDLAITEVMLEPSGAEPESEWFEIYNATAAPKLLSGLTIEDGYFDAQVIAATPAVVAPPFAYVVLVRDRAAASQSLVPAGAIVYAYGAGVPDNEGIELDAGDAGDLSLWTGDTRLVDVPYGLWDAAFVGRSIELAVPGSAPDVLGNWCLAGTPWSSGSDEGTPGASSDCSP